MPPLPRGASLADTTQEGAASEAVESESERVLESFKEHDVTVTLAVSKVDYKHKEAAPNVNVTKFIEPRKDSAYAFWVIRCCQGDM
eukprot:972000-Alexandrium_andersonii.AAC.1